MPNGKHQIEYLITEATERVAAEGTHADPTDILLAGLGYVAHELRRPQKVWEGKKVVAGSSLGGVGLGAGVVELIRAVFGG